MVLVFWVSWIARIISLILDVLIYSQIILLRSYYIEQKGFIKSVVELLTMKLDIRYMCIYIYILVPMYLLYNLYDFVLAY